MCMGFPHGRGGSSINDEKGIFQFRRAPQAVFAINGIKHALRVLPVIAAVAKISCRHGLWLVARENKKDLLISQKVLHLLVVIEF